MLDHLKGSLMQRGVNVLLLQCKIKVHGKLFNSLLQYSFPYVKLFLEPLKCFDSENPV